MGSPRSYVLRVYRQRTRIAGVAEDIRSGERHRLCHDGRSVGMVASATLFDSPAPTGKLYRTGN